MSHKLNSAQLAQYREQGYLDCGRVLADAAVTELRAMIDRMAAEAQAANINLSADRRQSYTLFTPVFTREPRYMDLVLRHPVILDILESVLGPVFRLLEDQLFYKPARHGAALAYHHDNIYYGFTAARMVTCWLALDDATPANGCLRLVPGSQLRDIPHKPIPGTILMRAVVNETEVIDLPAASGTLIIFDGQTVHGSGPNTTDRPRRAANMVAIAPTADGKYRKFNDALNPYLRGQVPAGGA